MFVSSSLNFAKQSIFSFKTKQKFFFTSKKIKDLKLQDEGLHAQHSQVSPLHRQPPRLGKLSLPDLFVDFVMGFCFALF
jgi:hypothetical protein